MLYKDIFSIERTQANGNPEINHRLDPTDGTAL